jgi:anti-sigma regulatory factor (Ser/Thr protein kinase)
VSTDSFAGEVSSVRAARRFVVAELAAESKQTVELAALVTSELATNAVIHGASRFDVDVRAERSAVRIEVTDWGPGDPATTMTPAYGVSGRGLRIVEELADDWGWARAGDAKTVWVLLPRLTRGQSSS